MDKHHVRSEFWRKIAHAFSDKLMINFTFTNCFSSALQHKTNYNTGQNADNNGAGGQDNDQFII